MSGECTSSQKGKPHLILFYYIELLIFLISWILLLRYINQYMTAALDSDGAAELVLSNLLARQRRILTQDWYYSTEIKFIGPQIIYSLLFRISNNWHQVRFWSVVIMHLIIIASLWFLCRSCRLTKLFPVAAAGVMLPVSSTHYYFVLEGAYYIPHIVGAFLGMALAFDYMNAESSHKVHRVTTLLFAFLLAVLSGCGGVRQIALFYFPMLVTGFFAVLLDYRSTRTLSRHSAFMDFSVVSLISFVGGITGCLINIFNLQQRYYFESWNKLAFCAFNTNNLIILLYGFFAVFGAVRFRTGGVELTQLLFAFILLEMTIVSLVYGIKYRTRVRKEYYLLSIFYIFAILVLLLSAIFTNMEFASRYLETVSVFSYLIIGMFITEFFRDEKKYMVSIACFLVIILSACCLTIHNLPRENKENEQRIQIANRLLSEDYYYGYSTYWNANIMTELSNGAIDMHSWADTGDGVLIGLTHPMPEKMANVMSIDQTDRWLQLKSHDTERPKGKVFILLTRDELKYSIWKDNLLSCPLLFSSDLFIVYGFDSYNEMASTIEGH